MLLNDTFTAADGSLLTDHSAESGATYGLNPAGGGVVRIHSGRAHADGAAFPYSSIEAADCEIEGVFRCLSADGQYAGLLGRMSTSSVAWYSLLLQFGGGVTLYGLSSFGSFSMTFTPGFDYRAKLVLKGSLIRAFINGYEFRRATSSEQTIGRVGCCFGAATSESTGLHLTSLIARDDSITRQVLFHGDSLTSGQGVVTLAHADRFPTGVMALLDSGIDWANLGVAGRTLEDLLASVAEVDNCRRPDAPSDVVVLWGGINDFALDSATVEQVIDRLTDYGDGRRELGFHVVVLTLIPADEAHPNISAEFDAQRSAVNTWLRANWSSHFDALADVAADPRLSDPADGTYVQTDGIHLTAAGAAAVAEIAASAIQSLGTTSLIVTAPLVDDVLLTGEPVSITWSTVGDVPTVRIQFSPDGGTSYSDLIVDLDNSGTYSWTPGLSHVTPAARIRVASMDGDSSDESPVFRIATTVSGGGLTSADLAEALALMQMHGDAAWGRNPILPVVARVNLQPVAKTMLVAYQLARSVHQLVVIDSTGETVDLSAMLLQFTLETLNGARIASTTEITLSGADSSTASFIGHESWHTQPGLFRYALRDITDGARVWARGDYVVEPTAGPAE